MYTNCKIAVLELVIRRGFETHAGYGYGYGSPFWDPSQTHTLEVDMAGFKVAEFEISHHQSNTILGENMTSHHTCTSSIQDSITWPRTLPCQPTAMQHMQYHNVSHHVSNKRHTNARNTKEVQRLRDQGVMRKCGHWAYWGIFHLISQRNRDSISSHCLMIFSTVSRVSNHSQNTILPSTELPTGHCQEHYPPGTCIITSSFTGESDAVTLSQHTNFLLFARLLLNHLKMVLSKGLLEFWVWVVESIDTFGLEWCKVHVKSCPYLPVPIEPINPFKPLIHTHGNLYPYS